MIKLSQLLDGMAAVANDLEVESIALDARQVNEGGLYIAVQGANTHGLKYLQQAIDNGVEVVVYEPNENASRLIKDAVCNVEFISVQNLSQQVSELAARFYGHPSKELKVIAITGTNGKTTCAYLLAQLLMQQGLDTAMIGTLGSGRLYELAEVGLTTPDAISLQRRLAEFKQLGITHVVMEASSHALAQHRLDAVAVDIAAFTNLSQDHLDYHASMQDYLAAKLRLFEFASLSVAVLNADQLASQDILKIIDPKVKVGAYKTNCEANELFDLFGQYCLSVFDQVVSAQGTVINFNYLGDSYLASTRLLGEFNVANLLLCIQVMQALGFELHKVLVKLAELQAPPGRLQRVTTDANGAPTVVVDYAHTPDALKNVLSTLKQLEHDVLMVVFGCGGDRDKSKRPLMGEISEELADLVYVTDDNPRMEASEQIIADILSGLKQPEKAIVISDRAAAIEQSVQKAKVSDIVLVAGKGHEDYQIVGNERLPFSDYAHAVAALELWQEVAA